MIVDIVIRETPEGEVIHYLLSEDERDALKEQVQELTKDYENKVGDMAKTRESEVMEN